MVDPSWASAEAYGEGEMIADGNMSCGHPVQCIISTPYIGEMASTYCGWCASEMRARAAEERIEEARKLLLETGPYPRYPVAFHVQMINLLKGE